MNFYYLSPDGETIGPVPAEEMTALYSLGQISTTSHVIREGDDLWGTYESYFPERWTPPLAPANTSLRTVTPSAASSSASTSIGQKFAAGFFYLLAVISLIMLIKTELRKWFVMDGQPSSANSGMFWLSLGGVVLFAWLGSACASGASERSRKNNSKRNRNF